MTGEERQTYNTANGSPITVEDCLEQIAKLKAALEFAHSYVKCCHAQHVPADYHYGDNPCPVMARYTTLREALK